MSLPKGSTERMSRPASERSWRGVEIGPAENLDVYVMNSRLKRGSLFLQRRRFPVRNVRPHDSGPADIPSRDGVRWPREGTANAPACISIESVGLVDQSAVRTRSRRVAGIDKTHRDTGQRRFIGDEGPQLEERPGVLLASLGPANSYPAAHP